MKTKTMPFKKIGIFFLCIAAVIFSPCACSTGIADNGKGMKIPQRPRNRVEGEYLIKLSITAVKEEIEKYFKDYKIIGIQQIGDRLYKLKIKDDPGPEVLRKIAEDSVVIEYIEPNYIYRATQPVTGDKLKPVE